MGSGSPTRYCFPTATVFKAHIHWLWWQTHETVNEREEEGRKRLLGKWKAEFCYLRNIHEKKHICTKYSMTLMVFHQFILFSSFRSLWKLNYWSPSWSIPILQKSKATIIVRMKNKSLHIQVSSKYKDIYTHITHA